jgi:hypothetical protein
VTTAAPEPRPDSRVAAGIGLIALGVIALGLGVADVDPTRWLGASGWTLFVIVPGLVLIGAGVIVPTAGLGLSIAGSIVAITGLLLLYQDTYDHYESWAYAWALVAPGGVGVGMIVHGLRVRRRDLIADGSRVVLTAAVIFVVGALFFETIFDRGRLPLDIGQAWPIVVLLAGAVLILAGLLGGRKSQAGPDR